MATINDAEAVREVIGYPSIAVVVQRNVKIKPDQWGKILMDSKFTAGTKWDYDTGNSYYHEVAKQFKALEEQGIRPKDATKEGFKLARIFSEHLSVDTEAELALFINAQAKLSRRWNDFDKGKSGNVMDHWKEDGKLKYSNADYGGLAGKDFINEISPPTAKERVKQRDVWNNAFEENNK